MYVLGISAYYHDSSAALIKDEKIIAAAQEERFSRIKHDHKFPKDSIKYCLREANISLDKIDYVAFYDKPFVKFERLLETYLTVAPKGLKSFLLSIPTWLKEKLFLKEVLTREIKSLFEELYPEKSKNEIKKFRSNFLKKLMFGEHHQSHASSAFFPSPFKEAAILTIDGVGEWATTSIAHGNGNKLKILKEIHFPHSLGLLYSAFTYYTGFKVNSGEYKVMGLAPYGKPIYSNLIRDNLIDIKEDGSFRLDMSFFNFTTGLTMTNKKFDELFGGPPREREDKLSQREMDLAASIQEVTEEIILKLARHTKLVTGSNYLCLAGGVALNCVGNGVLLRENLFDEIWIQPAAGDSGGALGAAYLCYYQEFNKKRTINSAEPDKMQGAYLGPKFTNEEIKTTLDNANAVYQIIENEEKLIDIISEQLVLEKVVGWHYDRMEFGPRALGHRSILGDARSKKMQSTMNLKIKYRESFRPFAPSILIEKLEDWFDLNAESPYMLLVAKIKKEKCYKMTLEEKNLFGIDKLNVIRSEVPAITHVDYSARIQSIKEETNSRYHKLISAFEKKTGCPIIVNTSFNVRGEPIVCSPEDSYRCFMRTGMDVLVIDDFILFKENQPKQEIQEDWKEQFELD